MLNEMKQYVMLHAKSQNLELSQVNSVLNAIKNQAIWPEVWQYYGDQYLAKNDFKTALAYYNLSRFPFATTSNRQLALSKYQQAFKQWQQQYYPKLTTLNIHYEGGTHSAYLLAHQNTQAPLLIVSGGIVSIKEQWLQFLAASQKLGCSLLLTEMPGVGTSTVRYHANSHHLYQPLLKKAKQFCDFQKIYFVAFSFSGHLALQYANEDQRVIGVTTVGAPLHYFFIDEKWWQQVPTLTKTTLAHLMHCQLADLPETLLDFSLTKQQLTRLTIPIYYINSLRDEIIPQDEAHFLKTHANFSNIKHFDDIHGSPHYLTTMQKYVPYTVLRTLKRKPIARSLLYLLAKFSKVEKSNLNLSPPFIPNLETS